MEDEIILSRPTDRRLVSEDNDLPPGPPGAENDVPESVVKEKTGAVEQRKSKERDSRRSRSKSPRRRSKSRRRSPSPYRKRRRSRSRIRDSPVRGRNYSPDRRRFNNRGRPRYSPDRNRRPNRYRGRRDSRSRSDSPKRRWSPGKKPASPPPQAPPPPNVSLNAGYNLVPQPVYGDGAYAAYGQYPAGFAGAEYAAAPPAPSFGAGYGVPPPAWGVPAPPGEDYDPQSTWTAQQAAAMPTQPEAVAQPHVEPQAEVVSHHDAAVVKEQENQREEFKNQRNSYLKKYSSLKKELKLLKDQRKDLVSDKAPQSPTTKGFLDENDRLQGQIQKKINTIESVIDMLTGIIGDKNPTKELDAVAKEAAKKQSAAKKRKSSASSSSSSSSSSSESSSSSSSSSSSDEENGSSSERLKSKAIKSMKSKRDEAAKKEVLKERINAEKKIKEELLKRQEEEKKRINYVFYDPEMHWCSICNEFPKTAKDYLQHLQSQQHTDNNLKLEAPWHDNANGMDEFPTYPNAQVKRIPIRGMQFFVPAAAWYCKLCQFWMGDLHCASAHLKSQQHSQMYKTYIDQNPDFEVEWMRERQNEFEMKNSAPPPPQITAISTTEDTPASEAKKGGDKNSKKKKKSDDKKDKKKKKRSKKHKKSASSSSSSSSDSSSESDSGKKTKESADRGASIRVAMRKISKEETKLKSVAPVEAGGNHKKQPELVMQLAVDNAPEDVKKRDELMMSQWNSVQPVISDSEKKLLEQLKGKLKNKPPAKPAVEAAKKDDSVRRYSRSRSRSPGRRGDRDRVRERSRSRGRRSRSRGGRRSRSRGRYGRSRSRGRRSRSRGKYSPIGYGSRRRRRSRSYDRRRRSNSRSRSRSSSHRIEKAIVHKSEFRPRVPEVKKKKEDGEKKKTPPPKKISSSTSQTKKLPFIGRMPVFKKQTQVEAEKKEMASYGPESAPAHAQHPHTGQYDNYEGSMMMDYDDLMPDPVQFVSLMGAPPPPPTSKPPPQYEDEKDILPPGIDETETDAVPQPISDTPIPSLPRKGPLPADFEEALNIIFPGDEKPEVKKSNGVTTIINDEPINQSDELAKQGIHMLTMEEAAAMDDASQMSMNEPLVFNTPSNFPPDSSSSQDTNDLPPEEVAAIPPPPVVKEAPEPEADKDKKEEAVVEEPEAKEEEQETPSDASSPPSPTNSDKIRRQEELDDLAMLGIDADDLAAQCM